MPARSWLPRQFFPRWLCVRFLSACPLDRSRQGDFQPRIFQKIKNQMLPHQEEFQIGHVEPACGRKRGCNAFGRMSSQVRDKEEAAREPVRQPGARPRVSRRDCGEPRAGLSHEGVERKTETWPRLVFAVWTLPPSWRIPFFWGGDHDDARDTHRCACMHAVQRKTSSRDARVAAVSHSVSWFAGVLLFVCVLCVVCACTWRFRSCRLADVRRVGSRAEVGCLVVLRVAVRNAELSAEAVFLVFFCVRF